MFRRTRLLLHAHFPHVVEPDSGPGRRGAPGRSAAAMRVKLPCACAHAARR